MSALRIFLFKSPPAPLKGVLGAAHQQTTRIGDELQSADYTDWDGLHGFFALHCMNQNLHNFRIGRIATSVHARTHRYQHIDEVKPLTGFRCRGGNTFSIDMNAVYNYELLIMNYFENTFSIDFSIDMNALRARRDDAEMTQTMKTIVSIKQPYNNFITIYNNFITMCDANIQPYNYCITTYNNRITKVVSIKQLYNNFITTL